MVLTTIYVCRSSNVFPVVQLCLFVCLSNSIHPRHVVHDAVG